MKAMRTRPQAAGIFWKFARAALLAFSGQRMSGGIRKRAGRSSAGSNTAAMAFRPAGVIFFCRTSWHTRSRFACESELLACRGENLWANRSPSMFLTVLSIQPKQSASRTASS